MDGGKVIVAGLVIAIMLLSAPCGIARYNECRRLHPIWYCIGDNR